MSQRILVIDDEAHIVQVLSLKLRNAGYEVLTACDGEEGLEVVRSATAGWEVRSQKPEARGQKAEVGNQKSEVRGQKPEVRGQKAEAGSLTSDLRPLSSGLTPDLRSLTSGLGSPQAPEHPIDLIITDFQMPYMTGLELCRELAKCAEWSRIPVLMLTARGYALEPEDLAIASADGGRMIRDVLTKPFSPRAIVEHIQRILGEGDKAAGNDGPGGCGLRLEASTERGPRPRPQSPQDAGLSSQDPQLRNEAA